MVLIPGVDTLDNVEGSPADFPVGHESGDGLKTGAATFTLAVAEDEHP